MGDVWRVCRQQGTVSEIAATSGESRMKNEGGLKEFKHRMTKLIYNKRSFVFLPIKFIVLYMNKSKAKKEKYNGDTSLMESASPKHVNMVPVCNNH